MLYMVSTPSPSLYTKETIRVYFSGGKEHEVIIIMKGTKVQTLGGI